MKFYLEDTTQVLSDIDTSQENGLTAQQAQERLEQYGPNKLAEGKKKSLFARFIDQIKDPMIIILLAAAMISLIVSIVEGANHWSDYADVFIILIVVLINAVLGVFQESKAEQAIEALQEMAAAMSKVIRDGEIIEIKSEELVPGDIILLEAGDAVPADARILESVSMKIEEAALTGESVPSGKISQLLTLKKDEKDVPLGDRKNMAYMGSTVVYGRGVAVVVATGMDTEMGKIADAIAQADEGQTPLQIKLGQLSKVLTVGVLAVCVVIFAFSLIKAQLAGGITGEVFLDTFLIAVALAVAAIPEGLAAVVTIVLSIGVTNMSKRNAIIRKLTAVETLGSAQIICSDKTGTLTQNKMTVVEHSAADENFLATAMALCTSAKLQEDGNIIGEPTEAALVAYANSINLPKPMLETNQPRVGEAPFDSVRKMMSTVHQTDGKIMQYTKGAPDVVIQNCTHILTPNGIVPLTQELIDDVLKTNKAFADKALRVLAVAYREYDAAPTSYEPADLENNLTFIGLVGMIDPVRPEVIDAIEECKDAGIRAIMITGDHLDTAVAIAKEIGILTDTSQAITGAQLNEMSDEEFEKCVGDFSVYARVQPEHKVRIVTAWKKLGKITAMTGDGVNDAPAMKSADIGVGMGITGTDVTKNVSDMVLADDNFATIVNAVEEGRRIYDNIRKTIQFLLSANLSEVLSIFFATMLGFTILQPAHILWINLITDVFPALALGMEKAEPDIMNRKPRKANENLFGGGLGVDVIYQGVLVTILILVAFLVGEFLQNGVWAFKDSRDGITMAFLTMSMIEIFHSFNLRSQRGSIFSLKGQNKFLWLAMIASFVMTVAVIYVPFLREAFDFTAISPTEFIVSMALAFSIIPLVEIVKFFQRLHAKRKANKAK